MKKAAICKKRRQNQIHSTKRYLKNSNNVPKSSRYAEQNKHAQRCERLHDRQLQGHRHRDHDVQRRHHRVRITYFVIYNERIASNQVHPLGRGGHLH